MKATSCAVAAILALGVGMGAPLAREGPQEATTAPRPGDPGDGCYQLSKPGCVCITEDQADNLIVERRAAEVPAPPPAAESMPATPTWMAASLGAGFLLGALTVFSIVR